MVEPRRRQSKRREPAVAVVRARSSTRASTIDRERRRWIVARARSQTCVETRRRSDAARLARGQVKRARLGSVCTKRSDILLYVDTRALGLFPDTSSARDLSIERAVSIDGSRFDVDRH
jgi:hypothetical protein